MQTQHIGGSVPRLVNCRADPRRALREWPVPSPRYSVDGHTLAAIFMMRALAAKISNEQVGLATPVLCGKHQQLLEEPIAAVDHASVRRSRGRSRTAQSGPSLLSIANSEMRDETDTLFHPTNVHSSNICLIRNTGTYGEPLIAIPTKSEVFKEMWSDSKLMKKVVFSQVLI